MRLPRLALTSAALALSLWPASSVQSTDGPDPRGTAVALRLLLSASNESIPQGSTCFGAYGQSGEPRVRDLLAVELASLYKGVNVISGSCTPVACSLAITHRAGEDVSSALINFRYRNSQLVIGSMACRITP